MIRTTLALPTIGKVSTLKDVGGAGVLFHGLTNGLVGLKPATMDIAKDEKRHAENSDFKNARSVRVSPIGASGLWPPGMLPHRAVFVPGITFQFRSP